MSHDLSHLPQLHELARSLSEIAAGQSNIVEAALVVRLACGFEATLCFSAAEHADTLALLGRAHAETAALAEKGTAPPGRTIQ